MRLVIFFVAALILAGAFPLAAQTGEVGVVKENSFKGFPSYAGRIEAGMYPGASLGLGFNALVNLTDLASTLLPVLSGTPRIWVSTQAVLLDTGLLFGIIKPDSSDAGDMGSILGFGGQTFKLGGGFTLSEGESMAPFRWIISQTTSGDIETTTYYPITGPKTDSFQVIGGLSFDRVGGQWKDVSKTFLEKYQLVDGWKGFLEGGVRLMSAYDFVYANKKTAETLQYRDWTSHDLKLGLATDLSMVGLSYEMAILDSQLGIRFGMGIYIRNDVPKLYKSEMMKGWYIPMWISAGWGGTPLALTDKDKAWGTE